MNYGKTFYGLLCLWGAFVGACSDPQAGGPSSVETQNSLAGVLVLENGTPVQAASVSLYSAKSMANTPLATTLTGADGVYEFFVDSQGLYSIEVRVSDSLQGRVLQKTQAVDSVTPVKTTLGKPIAVWFRLDSASWGVGQSLTVSQYGSSHQKIWNTQQLLSWEFPAAGSYAFQWTLGSETRDLIVQVPAQADTMDWHLSSEPSLPMASFEHRCNQSDFGATFGGGWFFSLQGGTDFEEPLPVEQTPHCQGDLLYGQVRYFNWAPADSVEWLADGFMLGETGQGVALSDLDSITLMAKGRGALNFELVAQGSDGKTLYKQYLFEKRVLSNNWAPIVLRTEELQSTIEHGILFFQWGAGDSVEVWMDQIQFHGVNVQNW